MKQRRGGGRATASRNAASPSGGVIAAGAERIRIDRWLFHVRMFRTRSLAAAQVSNGGIRVNGAACIKPAQLVGPGDIVTVATAGRVQVLRVMATGARRGPPAEARLLFEPCEPEEGRGA